MASQSNTAKCPPHLQLVRDDTAGSPPTFDAIFDQYVRYVNAVAMRLLGNRGDAEDVVQEVFWSCSKHVHKIQDMTHARRWLMQVTVQRAKRTLKKESSPRPCTSRSLRPRIRRRHRPPPMSEPPSFISLPF